MNGNHRSLHIHATFTLTHTLHRLKGGYTHLRHSETRDSFATLLKDVCHYVERKPKLQPLEAKTFTTKQPLLKITLHLTSRQMDYREVDSAEPFLM